MTQGMRDCQARYPSAHPYRDPEIKMSPIWFDSEWDRFCIDLRLIEQGWLRKDGKWEFIIAGTKWEFQAEQGARLYNAYRAYAESHFGT